MCLHRFSILGVVEPNIGIDRILVGPLGATSHFQKLFGGGGVVPATFDSKGSLLDSCFILCICHC